MFIPAALVTMFVAFFTVFTVVLFVNVVVFDVMFADM